MSQPDPIQKTDEQAGDTATPYAAAKLAFAGRKRTAGKFALLPPDLRLWVNESLRESLPGSAICAELAANGFPGFSDTNISNYYHGAYQHWLRHQERIEELRLRTEAALTMVQNFKDTDKAAFLNANETLLATQISDILQDFDTQRIKELLADKPEQYVKIAAVANAQVSEQLRREKFEFQKHCDLREQKRQRDQSAQSQSKGLTPEVLAQIEDAARLL